MASGSNGFQGRLQRFLEMLIHTVVVHQGGTMRPPCSTAGTPSVLAAGGTMVVWSLAIMANVWSSRWDLVGHWEGGIGTRGHL